MPDSSGKIRGISVPPVPWHELSDDEPHPDNQRHMQRDYQSAVRGADQMLWDKQTDEGPSALEKLRDKS